MDRYENSRLRVFMGDSKQLYTRQFVRPWSKLGLVILGAADVTGDGRPDVKVPRIR